MLCDIYVNIPWVFVRFLGAPGCFSTAPAHTWAFCGNYGWWWRKCGCACCFFALSFCFWSFDYISHSFAHFFFACDVIVYFLSYNYNYRLSQLCLQVKRTFQGNVYIIKYMIQPSLHTLIILVQALAAWAEWAQIYVPLGQALFELRCTLSICLTWKKNLLFFQDWMDCICGGSEIALLSVEEMHPLQSQPEDKVEN